MLELRNGRLRVLVDAARGAAIASIATTGGRELLYRAHWPPCSLEDAGEGEEAWTQAWQGGWNVLFPNAGAACVVGGRRHPFHGDASAQPWDVLDRDDRRAVFRWRDPTGLSIERDVVLDDDTVTASSRVSNKGESPTSYLLVEHLVLGEAVVGRAATVGLRGGTIVPLDDSGPPLPGAARPWPRVRRAEEEDWAVRPAGPASRFGAIHGVDDRRATVRDSATGVAVSVAWSQSFPYVWFWEEQRAYQGAPWDGRVACLALEPSTSSTGEGLGAAIARGEAHSLEPGETAAYSVKLALIELD